METGNRFAYSVSEPIRRISDGEPIEAFMSSLKDGEVYEHPETLRRSRFGIEPITIKDPGKLSV
jgi:hypothetical protein